MGAGDAETALRFGISLVPATERLDRIRELVRTADEAALDLVGIQDHPYQRRFLDTWSLIPTLLAETKRISFFTDVANLPLRPPAVMAKAAASLDVLSGGRFELGLGAGGFPDVIAGFGGPRRTPGESVEALEEAIDVIRLLWSTSARCRSRRALPARWRAPRPTTRAPDRDLGGSVQAADAPPRRPQGGRLAAVARRAHA